MTDRIKTLKHTITGPKREDNEWTKMLRVKLDQESSQVTGHSIPISNGSPRNLRSPKAKHRSGVGLEYSFCWLHTEYCQTKNSFQLCGCVLARKDTAKCTRKKEETGAQSWITWPTCMALQRTQSILPTSAEQEEST